ncbi:MAG TPA: argininosuccinate lyase [Candidatus Nanopelagicaceae bacterium]|nr:argininosuccinate lyase [Candidatus Nanopelagicaceae bacterium]
MGEMRLWGGRFAEQPADAMAALSVSVHFDWRLAKYDLLASKAHARMLRSAALLDEAQLGKILAALTELEVDVASGAFTPTIADEDVHTALERGLVEKLGELGGALRAGRSRNDQVATDLRLYLKDEVRILANALLDLEEAVVAQASNHVDSIAPGFTHLQHAQPVTFGHELAKHAHALSRDVSRLRDWESRADFSPLGAGALSGSSLIKDPKQTAKELGFKDAIANSIDAVSDRDFVAELLFISALIGVHLSRIGEEFAIWASREFGWVKLSDAYSTGSSIMPQKKNPDVAELARGKSGRLIGHLTGFLATLKGLPFAYNRDLQEDKEPIFDSLDTLRILIPAVTGMVATSQFDAQKMAKSAPEGFALATEIADWLVRQGMPFRSAHEVAGECVRICESRSIELDVLSDADFAAIHPMLTPEVREVLSAGGAVASRQAFGGTAPVRVREQLMDLREVIESDRAWANSVSPAQ